MYILPSIKTLAVAFAGLQAVAADFHMLGIQLNIVAPLAGSTGILYKAGGMLIPSNQYNCNWVNGQSLYSVESAGKTGRLLGSCNYKTASFTHSGICGGGTWQFDKTNNGYSVSENGQNIATCYSNCGHVNDLNCHKSGSTSYATEDYVCYSYYCKGANGSGAVPVIEPSTE